MRGNAIENLLLLGKVIRPHGLEGLLKIKSYAESEQSFLNAGTVLLRSDTGQTKTCKVISVRPHKNICLMQLEGINSVEEAERYRRAEVFIRRDALDREKSDGYYWFELIGLKVYLNDGKYIGTLEHIWPTGGNDIYVVRDRMKEVLIPAIDSVVEHIDLANKKMVISEMEGLLDINEI